MEKNIESNEMKFANELTGIGSEQSLNKTGEHPYSVAKSNVMEAFYGNPINLYQIKSAFEVLARLGNDGAKRAGELLENISTKVDFNKLSEYDSFPKNGSYYTVPEEIVASIEDGILANAESYKEDIQNRLEAKSHRSPGHKDIKVLATEALGEEITKVPLGQ